MPPFSLRYAKPAERPLRRRFSGAPGLLVMTLLATLAWLTYVQHT